MTERNETAIALRQDFERAIWAMLDNIANIVGDPTEGIIDNLSAEIAALPASDIDALTAKAVVAYFWSQDAAGTLQQIKADDCVAEVAKADALIAAVEVLAPEFKANLDWILMRDAPRPIAA